MVLVSKKSCFAVAYQRANYFCSRVTKGSFEECILKNRESEYLVDWTSTNQ